MDRSHHWLPIFYALLAQLVDAALSKGVCSPFESGEGYHISGYSIMDNTVSFYLTNVGSIPASRTIKYTTAFGEMDIISVFETDGGSSILSRPAKVF
jgi:hypothetical protein